MSRALLIFCVSLTGCSVMQDAKTEFRKEMVGFKYNWDRSVLKKDVPYNYE
jgi:hypothetical protein